MYLHRKEMSPVFRCLARKLEKSIKIEAKTVPSPTRPIGAKLGVVVELVVVVVV